MLDKKSAVMFEAEELLARHEEQMLGRLEAMCEEASLREASLLAILNELVRGSIRSGMVPCTIYEGRGR